MSGSRPTQRAPGRLKTGPTRILNRLKTGPATILNRLKAAIPRRLIAHPAAGLARLTSRPGSPPIAARVDRCAMAMALLMCALLAAAMARVVQLQLAPEAELRPYLHERVSRRPVPAIRGDLRDRRGRLLATTRLGYRVFIDPTRFPDPPDEAILLLAGSLGEPPERLGERIVLAQAANAQRAAAMATDQQTQTRADVRRELLQTVQRRFGLTSLGRDEPPAQAEAQLPKSDDEPADRPRPLIRYLRLTEALTDEQLAAVRDLRVPGLHLERCSVRSYPGGDLAASIVGKVGFEHTGLLGAEYALQRDLTGADGRVSYVRDAYGRPLWIEVGQFEPARRGEDVRLSIDLELQRIARRELERGVEDADAAGGRLVMLDPITGEVLAMVDIVREPEDAEPYPWIRRDEPIPPWALQDWAAGRRFRVLPPDPGRDIHPALARNRCVEDVYEPGSTFKPFVWAAVTELGRAELDEVFNTEDGRWRTSYGRAIEDVVKRREMTWREVLVNSSNIGMTKGAERLTPKELHDAVRRFGFGSPTGIGLPGEASGLVTRLRDWSKYTHTSVAFGYEVAATPVQIARAYGALARPGELAGTLPPVRLTATDQPGDPGVILHRVLPPGVAVIARVAMAGVVENLDRLMDRVYPEEPTRRYTMFGKSGTALIALGAAPEDMRSPPGVRGYYPRQYTSSFVAGAPVEDPRLVVIVVIDDPGPGRVRSNTYYGSHVAGPVVRRVTEQSLAYLGIPPSPRGVAAR